MRRHAARIARGSPAMDRGGGERGDPGDRFFLFLFFLLDDPPAFHSWATVEEDCNPSQSAGMSRLPAINAEGESFAKVCAGNARFPHTHTHIKRLSQSRKSTAHAR